MELATIPMENMVKPPALEYNDIIHLLCSNNCFSCDYDTDHEGHNFPWKIANLIEINLLPGPILTSSQVPVFVGHTKQSYLDLNILSSTLDSLGKQGANLGEMLVTCHQHVTEILSCWKVFDKKVSLFDNIHIFC